MFTFYMINSRDRNHENLFMSEIKHSIRPTEHYMIIKTQSLTPSARAILCDKATEAPCITASQNQNEHGSWLCRQCGLALFRAHSRFNSGCGWPAFNGAIHNCVNEKPDADGLRDEIVCARCGGHLGHVFRGEGLTPENLRHCVNSLSLDFVLSDTIQDTEEAIVAGGCFWGIEYLFKQLQGIVKTEAGYIGGKTNNPSYESVCRGDTGHYEAVRVLYDPKVISYSEVIKYFYEIHTPEQADGQGPDRGSQYQSAIFSHNESQTQSAEEITALLKNQGINALTRLLPAKIFWPAEEYHQNYYSKQGTHPYCHHHVKKFK